MFSFYGSKSRIAKYYPPPKYDTIIEPFAGSARYSLLHHSKNVILYEKDPIIFGVWKYLISANRERILSLPDVPNATRLTSIPGFSDLANEEKWLIGFCSNGGSSSPKNVSGRLQFNSWNKDRQRIADNLWKIRHWRIYNLSFENAGIENTTESTWFIDPPYENKGKWYKEGSKNIDYVFLGNWCRERVGQVIVCENSEASWLPFKDFMEIQFTHFKNKNDRTRKTKEAIWVND